MISRRVGWVVAGLVELAACGGTGGGNGGPTVGGTGTGPGNGPHPPWTELAKAELDLEGGAATSPGGQGQPGGQAHVVTAGDVTFDPQAPAAPAPDVPAPPDQTPVLASDELGADVAKAGTIRIGQNTSAAGADGVRRITVTGGDIYVEGTLRGADLGGTRQGISLQAPDGTVYVTGAVDTSGGGDGQAGGAIDISARRVIVTGRLRTGGADGGAQGGPAGTVSIAATESVAITGTIDSFGGNAREAGAVLGGRGGDLTLRAGTDLTVSATVLLRGGAATGTGTDARGGDAATLTADASGTFHLAGTIDARGGFATAKTAGGTIAGGAAGNLRIGETVAPASLIVLIPLSLSGGDGAAQPGPGGALAMEPKGTVRLAGEIIGDGGSIAAGGAGNGAVAANVTIEDTAETGAFIVAPTGMVTLDGGGSGGVGTAGGGGHFTVRTLDGDMSMGGTLNARGGAARDPGGSGGLGGMIYLFSDNNHNGFGGNLTIETTGLIDASGGTGTMGGAARNNGDSGDDVASFPDNMEQLAVLLNSDGMHGTTRDGVLQMMGRIVARGGATNGRGGDVAYHARALDGGPQAPVGNVVTDGDGSGPPGQVRSE